MDILKRHVNLKPRIDEANIKLPKHNKIKQNPSNIKFRSKHPLSANKQ